jgi:hypothetical protein
MITDSKLILKFEKEFSAKDLLSLDQKFNIIESLYRQSCSFGHFTNADLLDGLEVDVELARKLNINVSISSR